MSGDGGRDEQVGRAKGWRPEDWLDGYGALDPDGRFLDAQRAGIETAAAIVERFAAGWSAALGADRTPDGAQRSGGAPDRASPEQPSEQPSDDGTRAGPSDGAPGDRSDAGAGARDPLRDLRMEAVRSLDAAMDLTRRIVESSLDLADAALRRPHVATWATTDGPTTAVAAIDVHARAGGSGSATAWLHHQGDPVGPISWRASGPTDAAGSPVAAVRVGPPALDRLGDGERVQLTVDVDVDPTTPAGTYHAMVLAIGAEETALVVRIVVAEAGSGSAGSGSAGAAP